MYEERTYRKWILQDDLIPFEVSDKETDLLISAEIDLSEQAHKAVAKYRKQLEEQIRRLPEFLTAKKPIDVESDVTELIKAMVNAANLAGVGPMAAVAGAIAEFVGKELLEFTEQVIVENGGDIFIKTSKPKSIGVFAGNSPFTGKIAFVIKPGQTPIGICTSSGTVGHSLSYGKADAVAVFSKDTALADAVATATANRISHRDDINPVIEFAKSIEDVEGIVAIIEDACGIWGNIEIADWKKP